MTHAEVELERLKTGFADFTDRRTGFLNVQPGDPSERIRYAEARGMETAAKLFWPFVAYALSDMQGSAAKTAMLNLFKASLGMELMAHERIGVDLQCTCNAGQAAGHCKVHAGMQK